MSNVVTAVFRDGATSCRAPGLWQWDYGQILQITGVELPRAVEVHFSRGDDAGTRMGVTEDGICSVAIPDIYLQEADPIDVYVYLHTGDDDGETEYHIILPIRGRTKPVDYDPEDPEISAAYQALVDATQLLQGDIETVGEYKDAAEDAAERAERAAESLVVDDEMSGTSKNPVQNRVISEALTDLKEDINKKMSAPSTPGIQGQVLTSDGEGGQSWEDPSGGGGTVKDVKVNGVSVLNAETGEANVPIANKVPGVVQVEDGTYGLVLISQGSGSSLVKTPIIAIYPATNAMIKNAAGTYSPLTPDKIDRIIFYGLAKAAGDTTQSASSNAVGTYTDEAKSKIHDMLDAPVTVSSTDPVITAKSGVRYVCGECATLTFTPPASGICDVTFTSGATATVLTLPSTVVMPDGFEIEANKRYEINIMDGLGVYQSWEV